MFLWTNKPTNKQTICDPSYLTSTRRWDGAGPTWSPTQYYWSHSNTIIAITTSATYRAKRASIIAVYCQKLLYLSVLFAHFKSKNTPCMFYYVR